MKREKFLYISSNLSFMLKGNVFCRLGLHTDSLPYKDRVITSYKLEHFPFHSEGISIGRHPGDQRRIWKLLISHSSFLNVVRRSSTKFISFENMETSGLVQMWKHSFLYGKNYIYSGWNGQLNQNAMRDCANVSIKAHAIVPPGGKKKDLIETTG